MKITVDSLAESPGYTVLKRWIPEEDLREISEIELSPLRGKTAQGLYWANSDHTLRPDLALWWSQQVRDHPTVQKVAALCISAINAVFDRPRVYSADCIVNTPANQQKVYPHLDTPYRFPQWHKSRDMLAVQFLIPLGEFTAENGATAVVENSHRYLWNINDLYTGVYDQWFLDNLKQVSMQPGDILVYNPRLLHSTMPNHTDKDRRALLISVMDHMLAETLIDVDNIWL